MTDTNTVEEESVVAKPAKEVPIVQDEGYFQHSTGDTYEGAFEAKKKDRTAKMHGRGVYKTAEGDIYTGMWDNDKLGANEEVTVFFADKSSYEGSFKDWCYSGRGKYLYPDGSTLLCDFSDNCPVGKLRLFDPNGHTWLGKAEPGCGWFEPVNHYYEMLAKSRETMKMKRRRQTQE